MSKNIFDQSTQDKLSDVFGSMTTPKVIEESTETPVETPVKEEVNTEEVVNTEAPKQETTHVGDAFDAVYNSIFQEKECKDCDKDCEKDCKCKKVVSEEVDEYTEELPDSDDSYDEDVMVSVPKALLDELYAYVEDTMGSEDESSVDDVDFELPEEGTDHVVLANKLKNTEATGSPKQAHKLKKSAGKTGKTAQDSNVRSGKASFLKNLLGCYVAKGSSKQKNDTSVKDVPVNK